MSFHPESYLRRATSRAKSDVANKLASMFLHEVSRKSCLSIGLNVSDSRYIEAVFAHDTFGLLNGHRSPHRFDIHKAGINARGSQRGVRAKVAKHAKGC